MMRRHIQISQCREKNWVMIAAPMKQLAEFGYFNVKIMDGGLEKWMESKYPTLGPSGKQVPPPEVSQLASAPAKNNVPCAAH